MNFEFLPGQNYDCVCCGRSCRGWQVQVDPGTRGRVRGSELELRVLEETGLSSTLVPGSDQTVNMARRGEGCVYLDERSLCRIHGELGEAAKPLGCRQFPFLLAETPDGVVVGVSFYCTSVRDNSGRPLEAHAPELERLLRRVRPRRVGFDPILVHNEQSADWADYKKLEAFLQEGLQREQPPDLALAAALWSLGVALEEGRPFVDCPDPGGGLLLERHFGLNQWRFACLTVLVGSQEAATGEEACAFTDAMREDRTVTFTRSGWTGRRSTIDARATDLPAWVNQEIRRYLTALIFRKFLLLDGSLLENLCGLYMLPPLLRFFALVRREVRGGGGEVLREDYLQSLEWVELELSHTRQGSEGLWTTFARVFREQMRLALAA